MREKSPLVTNVMCAMDSFKKITSTPISEFIKNKLDERNIPINYYNIARLRDFDIPTEIFWDSNTKVFFKCQENYKITEVDYCDDFRNKEDIHQHIIVKYVMNKYRCSREFAFIPAFRMFVDFGLSSGICHVKVINESVKNKDCKDTRTYEYLEKEDISFGINEENGYVPEVIDDFYCYIENVMDDIFYAIHTWIIYLNYVTCYCKYIDKSKRSLWDKIKLKLFMPEKEAINGSLGVYYEQRDLHKHILADPSY